MPAGRNMLTGDCGKQEGDTKGGGWQTSRPPFRQERVGRRQPCKQRDAGGQDV